LHTEHLQNVTLGRVVAGWLVAAAVTSLAAFALTAMGIMNDDATASNTWGIVLAVTIGFFAGGFFSGFRAIQAPILHAVAIGLMTLIVWAILNTITALLEGHVELVAIYAMPGGTVTFLLVQMAAAMIGALLGYNMALRGRPGLSEHEPV
jgi:hypothetical protein